MKFALLIMSMTLSGVVRADNVTELENALQNSALMYGGYGDESVICGGEVINYQIVAENSAEVRVKALITESVNYCASETQVECLAIFSKDGNSYKQKSFICAGQ